MQRYLLFVLTLFASGLFADVAPLPIPRFPVAQYFKEGVFAGGQVGKANIENLRYFFHAKGRFERWVLDFSDGATRTIDHSAPRFQLRYTKSVRALVPTGTKEVSPARLTLFLQNIGHDYLSQERIDSLISKSHVVKKIVQYPQIEDGDMAIDFILKSDVPFDPHEPLQNEGRLVLDFRR